MKRKQPIQDIQPTIYTLTNAFNITLYSNIHNKVKIQKTANIIRQSKNKMGHIDSSHHTQFQLLMKLTSETNSRH